MSEAVHRPCPSCGPMCQLDDAGNCSRCLGVMLAASAVGTLAERVGVSVATLRELTAAAPPANGICSSCQLTLRHVRLRGVPVYVCGRCGVGFVSDSALKRLNEGQPLPTAPPAETQALVEGPRSEAVDFATAAPTERERLRWAAIPVAIIVMSSAPTWLVLKNPLFASVITLACAAIAVVVPAPTALLVRTLAPRFKEQAALFTTLLVTIVIVVASFTCPIEPWPFLAAVVCGGLFSLLVSTSQRATVRVLRIAAGISLAMVVGQQVRATLHKRAHDGCPAESHWDTGGGRHCERNDGRWHGPGRREHKDGVDVGTWVDGVRAGSFTTLRASGIKKGEGVFVDDLEEGPWILYGDDGVITESGPFKRGVREGAWRTYKDGAAVDTRQFSNGREVVRTP